MFIDYFNQSGIEKTKTEFKQIIGRGTRVYEGKDFFTIIDFVGATNLFYDKAWDDDPLSVDIKTTSIADTQNEDTASMVNEKDDDTRHSELDSESKEHPKTDKVTIDIKGKKLKVINIEGL